MGDSLSTAKSCFNELYKCFPLALLCDEITTPQTLAKISDSASLCCIPNAVHAPSTLLSHLIEGNHATFLSHNDVKYVKPVQFLIHCTNIDVADKYVLRNTSILFLTEHYMAHRRCFSPRMELRKFISHATNNLCLSSVHCHTNVEMCENCILNASQ